MEDLEQLLTARRSFERESERLRPDLHRFCARMTGSLSDGEDAVQETLVHAFYHLPELRELAALRPWLFRIAHNRCVDLLRRRRVTTPLDEADAEPDESGASPENEQAARAAFVGIFTELPPKERACAVLKDVLGYSLEETAEITSSNVGAVKAALHRARHKLERAAGRSKPQALTREHRQLIQTYLDHFNRRDWDGVRALLREDTRLEVVERAAGPMLLSRYFENYAKLDWPWQLSLTEVEGEPAVVHFRRDASGQLRPHSLLLIDVEDDHVSLVRDYVHIGYLLAGARVSSMPSSE